MLELPFMDAEMLDSNRKTRQMGVRLFEDQIEFLDWLIVHKYRKNRTRSAIIREILDAGIEQEKK
jgi:predicted DNA-binding protein